jgi:hypothetical protein
MKRALLVLLAACGSTPKPVNLAATCPTTADDYDDVVWHWTRQAKPLHDHYQEAAKLAAVFRSPEWRVAYAAREAEHRGLAANALQPQACANAAGDYEVEILLVTYDRNMNDLDRGKKSVWTVRLLDDKNNEIAPLDIVKDKRPLPALQGDFPVVDDLFRPIAYIARFPKASALLGSTHAITLRLSTSIGSVDVTWEDH